jgi:hypothetical protein
MGGGERGVGTRAGVGVGSSSSESSSMAMRPIPSAATPDWRLATSSANLFLSGQLAVACGQHGHTYGFCGWRICGWAAEDMTSGWWVLEEVGK